MEIAKIETPTLVAEVIKRMPVLSSAQKMELAEQLSGYLDSDDLPYTQDDDIPNESLGDEMKREIILACWDKYTSFQFEEKLK